MSVDDWQAVGIVSGAILAVLTLASLLYRKLVRPMWRAIRMWTRVAEQLLGDREHGVPSLMDQLQSLAENQMLQGRQLAEHLEWHADPGGQPAGPVRSKPNSGTPPRRTR
ncbi:MAG TPA: hypothetical protein VF174_08760 [Micromonosporaceae bacterium]